MPRLYNSGETRKRSESIRSIGGKGKDKNLKRSISKLIVNMGDFKQNFKLSLISPQPKRLHADVRSSSRRNPFQESQLPPIKSSCLNCDDEDRVLKELHLILSRPSPTLPPITKKTPSPSFLHKNKPPSRPKGNPIVNDEKFQELNSTASTFVSSFEEQ